jgi:hypothetical protein
LAKNQEADADPNRWERQKQPREDTSLMIESFKWLINSLEFVDAHNGAITAIATILIAGFTVVLARVTGRQANLTRRRLSFPVLNSTPLIGHG